jgi:hypothetical protein
MNAFAHLYQQHLSLFALHVLLRNFPADQTFLFVLPKEKTYPVLLKMPVIGLRFLKLRLHHRPKVPPGFAGNG